MSYLLLLPYLLLAYFIMREVLERQATNKKRLKSGIIAALILYFPFGWDVIVGRTVFYSLCATQGGVDVYKTVILSDEYFDSDGIPLFYAPDKFIHEMEIANRYVGRSTGMHEYIKPFNIKKNIHEIVDVNNDEILSSVTDFTYFGGWFVNKTGFHVSGISCPNTQPISSYLIDMSKLVFLNNHN